MQNIRLTDLICQSFYSLHKAIKNNEFTHYWLAGGRGSTKSSFISIEIIIDLIRDKNSNAIIFRKQENNLRGSVFNQMLWAIDKLSFNDYFKATYSPLQIIYKPTGQSIYFRGTDDPNKSKSIKLVNGYFKNIWFEELTEFCGMEEIRILLQSLMRGGNKFNVFYSYNPPININNWTNVESLIGRTDKILNKSNYLNVPSLWLGEQFIIEAEHLKKVHEEVYRHEYLGESVGNGLNIFTNLEIRKITAEEINSFDNIKQGIDWGYATDPFVYVKMHYSRKYKRLYLFEEVYKHGLLNDRAMELLTSKVYKQNYIIADSAEPKSIDDFKRNGFLIKGAEKGKDSIRYGIKFLQGMEKIIIDPISCPNTYKEFIEYELIKNKQGGIREEFPDKNNHCVDAVRYATESEQKLRTINIQSSIR